MAPWDKCRFVAFSLLRSYAFRFVMKLNENRCQQVDLIFTLFQKVLHMSSDSVLEIDTALY